MSSHVYKSANQHFASHSGTQMSIQIYETWVQALLSPFPLTTRTSGNPDRVWSQARIVLVINNECECVSTLCSSVTINVLFVSTNPKSWQFPAFKQTDASFFDRTLKVRKLKLIVDEPPLVPLAPEDFFSLWGDDCWKRAAFQHYERDDVWHSVYPLEALSLFNREVSKEDKALRIPLKVLDEKWKILLLCE